MGRRRRTRGMTRAERWRRARDRFNARRWRQDAPKLGVLLVVGVIALMVLLEALSPMSMEDATGRRGYGRDRRDEWWNMLSVLVTKLEVFLMRRVGMPQWAIVAASGAVVVGCVGVVGYLIWREVRGDDRDSTVGSALADGRSGQVCSNEEDAARRRGDSVR